MGTVASQASFSIYPVISCDFSMRLISGAKATANRRRIKVQEHGMCRRVHVEADDVLDLLREDRIERAF